MPDLSILIPSLKTRSALLGVLRRKIEVQASHVAPQFTVEVLDLVDQKERTVGTKRNLLLEAARGDFICFVDDDDDISDNYILRICQAIRTRKDLHCVGIKGIITTDGANPKTFVHSIKYERYFEEGGVYYRPPNHLNPVRRDLAMKSKFQDWNRGEDTRWAMELCTSKVLKIEYFVDEPIYFYRFDTKKTETQR